MKNKTKVLFTSLITIVVALCIGAGATFALFTSSVNNNITVSSGKVNVSATLGDRTLYSAISKQEYDAASTKPTVEKVGDTIVSDDDENGNTYYNMLVDSSFATGGSAVFADGTLTLDKVMPGDKVVTSFNVTNNSNVDIKYRLVAECADETYDALILYSKLSFSFDDESMTGIKKYVSDWTLLAAGGIIADCPISVQLPISAPNSVQEKTTHLKFTVEAIQSNVYTENGKHTFKLDLGEETVAKKTGEETLANVTLTTGTTIVEVVSPSVKVGTGSSARDLVVGDKLRLVVEETNETPAITIEEDEKVECYNISVKDQNNESVSASEAGKINVSIYVGTGKTITGVYHNTEEVTGWTYENGYVKFSTTSFSPFSIVYEPYFASGSGTELDPFIINNASQLKNITNYYNEGCYCYKIADGVTTIDCSTVTGLMLNGSFNGNGVTFTNLIGDCPLFKRVETSDDSCAIVENFTMDSSCNITKTYGAAAVIRDLDAKSAIIRNVTSNAVINASNHAAALIGYINNTDNHAWGDPEEISNCSSVLIKDCVVGGVVYAIGKEPASLLLGYSMQLKDGSFAAVSVVDCDLTGGHIYLPENEPTAVGYVYGAQQINGITVDGQVLTNALNTLDSSQISRYSKISPEQKGEGYVFEKAEGATSACIEIEARGSINGQKGCCYVLFIANIDISSLSGEITIPNLSKITNIKLNGSDDYEHMYIDEDGVMYLHMDGYDVGTASLARLTVTQYKDSSVISTGMLSLPAEAD